jgi:hypothetical protein
LPQSENLLHKLPQNEARLKEKQAPTSCFGGGLFVYSIAIANNGYHGENFAVVTFQSLTRDAATQLRKRGGNSAQEDEQ